ncbi:MAG: flagellar hook-basal body protein [Clostridiales bacterium]|jgi:flagellar basal body rod protein FlgG|nr:flagellar hook-basal body protein [Clostridiales bacterium]
MLSGFYTASSGMLVQQRNLNIISNNLVNSQTTGYKSERLITTTFDHEFLTRIEKNNNERIGSGSPVSLVDDVITNFNGSSLDETERPLDMAIVGEGFFNIQGEERQYMTRNGNFNIDQEGYLVLDGVGRVLGQNGAINLNGSSDFTVSSNGSIFDTNGQYVDRLLITMPAEGANMTKYNNGLYSATGVVELNNATVYQNVLERSNTDMNLEYTRLIEAQRAFSSCSAALRIIDQMNAKAATLASIG